jgi:DNA-binding MarR family transcriptional regulator
MRIQPGDMIAGQPALAMRKLMRRGRAYGPTTSGNSLTTIAEVLGVDLSAARLLFQELCQEGYIEPTQVHTASDRKEKCWYTTTRGNALANAKASKPITRQTADRLIEQFLSRVKQINTGEYAYRVGRVIVFGSYLSDAPTLGDVDLSIELDDCYQDTDARKMGHDARIAAAQAAGRRFRDSMVMLFWPRQEVLLLLKNRSHGLSLHDEGREQVLKRHIPSRILYDVASPTRAEHA